MIMGKTLGSIAPGNIVKIGGRDYIVLSHEFGTTSLITRRFVDDRVFDANIGDYAESEIRRYLNSDFYNELRNAVGEFNIVRHSVDLMADDGTGKDNVVFDNVSLLTTDLYRKYRDHLPGYGSWWWLATPYSKVDGYSRHVCCVYDGGSLNGGGCRGGGGVRPFCVLDSSILNFEM